MKKIKQFISLMVVVMLLSGCSVLSPQEESTLSAENTFEISTEVSFNTTESGVETTVVPEVPAETESVVQEPEATVEPATEAAECIPVEDVINYFCEVVLKTEYSDGVGDATLVQKWTERICYRIYGEATEEDKRVLTEFFRQLNEIEGFPGIVPAGENDLTDLALYFYDYDKFNQSFGEFLNYEAADGAVQYWYYTETNEIYDARIGYRKDIDQYTRNSVLLEEIVNGLGITDTILREDSITYQGFSQPQELSEIDWLMIKLLYHPKMEAGLNREECVNVIREIYPIE